MLDTWEQRVRRDGIKLTKVSFPVPPQSLDELADRLLGAITPATKVLHFCHITNLTGQIFPVKRICDEARRRGIKTIVDGAHAFAHFPVQGERISAATSTARACTSGCSRRSAPASSTSAARTSPTLWPLTPAAAAKANDIRKFEEIGTHPAANHNAIAEALAFHEGIGIERKAARLRYLRDRWATRLAAAPEGSAPHQPRSGALVRDRHRSDHRRADAPKSSQRLWDTLAHHRHADRARRIRRRADHAERLHDARRDRHVCGSDGADCPEGHGLVGG